MSDERLRRLERDGNQRALAFERYRRGLCTGCGGPDPVENLWGDLLGEGPRRTPFQWCRPCLEKGAQEAASKLPEGRTFNWYRWRVRASS